MTQALTKEYFDQALKGLPTKNDVAASRNDILGEVQKVDAKVEGLATSFSSLASSIDRYLKRTETWHDEFIVLEARFKQVVNLLDQRGIIKEEETHLV